MRIPLGLFVVSALLFVFGLGFVVVGAGEIRKAPALTAAASTASVESLATTKQIMDAITRPTADAIFRSVQTTVSEKGVEEIFPRNDDEWMALGAQAAALAESGYLLTTGARPVDQGDWIKMSQAMIDSAKQAMEAVKKKDTEGVLAAGEAVNVSCDNCHARYRRE
jgi:hypothetical protein